jgi:hypothetical protein
MMDDTGHTPHIDAPIRTLGVIEQWLTEILGPDSVLDRITNLG